MKKILALIGICLVFLIGASLLNKPHTDTLDDTQNNTAGDRTEEVAQYRKLYELKPLTQKPDFSISAKSAIIINAQNGEIIFDQNANEKLPPASITKIMTGILALEHYDLEKKILVSKEAAAVEPNKIVMKEGEKMKVKDLLYGLMMISANDAAEVLAEGIDGNRNTFLEEMNEKCKLLELKNTTFKNPSGLDEEGHYSSAYDIAKITYYAIKTKPEIIQYLGFNDAYSIYPTADNESHWWGGHISSTLDAYPEMIGAKTGYTEDAKNTFIGIAEKNNQKFIFIFLGSDEATEDAKALLEFILTKI